MHVIVLSDDILRQELIEGTNNEITIDWPKSIDEFDKYPSADAYFDLLFEPEMARINLLKRLSQKPVFINSVEKKLSNIDEGFIRINAWPTFLKRSLLEASVINETLKLPAEKIISLFNRHIEWLPDQPGFVSARVVAMIINEAYFVLGENVSTKEQIDIAMKLGTNYPYGPFEWSKKIGIKRILKLLVELNSVNSSYKPAPQLINEANLEWP